MDVQYICESEAGEEFLFDNDSTRPKDQINYYKVPKLMNDSAPLNCLIVNMIVPEGIMAALMPISSTFIYHKASYYVVLMTSNDDLSTDISLSVG